MSRISRVHDSKNDEWRAFRACTTQRTPTVSHFSPARIQKRPMSRISRLHHSRSNECLAFRACTTQNTTTVSRFALARLKKRRQSRISHLRRRLKSKSSLNFLVYGGSNEVHFGQHIKIVLIAKQKANHNQKRATSEPRSRP